MNLFSLAWKNLSRYKKRTIITASALTFGLVAYIYVDSLLQGAELESERNYRQYEVGDGRIAHADYWEERDRLPLDLSFNPEAILAQLESTGIRATPRVHFNAEAIVYHDPYPEDGALYVQVYGIDPTSEQVFPLVNTLQEGTFVTPGDDGVVIGGWLAEDIGAQVGYPITLSTRTRNGYRQTIDTIVAGIINCPNPYVNRRAVFMALDRVDDYLQMQGMVTEITVAALNKDDDTTIANIISTAGGGNVAYLDFSLLAREYLELAEAKSGGSQIMLLILFVIAAVGISNTMLMTILERTKEIGMLRAFGMNDTSIARMIIYEAVGIGLLGAIAGVIIGALLNIQLVYVGIDYGKWLREIDLGYRITSQFRGTWSIPTFVSAFITSIFLAVITAILPVRRMLRRLSITDCLRAS